MKLLQLKKASIESYLRRLVETRWRRRDSFKQRAHRLDHRLIVSLTSYPARYPWLAFTLKCLLNQSVAPDKVLLWIAISDFDSLPREVLALTAYGLQIEVCEDLKSYNKIIPALAKFNDAYIATADDDVFYWRSWLKELVGAVRPAIKEVVCHRAHRIRLAANGLPLPYLRWAWNTRRRIAHPLNFPTGHAGVLYPPGIFHADVMNVDQIKALCPTADDVWLFWMASRGGASFRKVGRRRAMVTWLGSQERNLYEQNISQGGNDSQIQRMIRTYGFPPKSG